MKAQKEVVRYGWHDCLNGRREGAEGENQALSAREMIPDLNFYTDRFTTNRKMTYECCKINEEKILPLKKRQDYITAKKI